MQIITRAEAKEKGLKRYFTGKPCPHNHYSERNTTDGGCIECKIAYRNRPEKKALASARKKIWMEKHKEEIAEKNKEWYYKTIDTRRKKSKEYKEKNKERIAKRHKKRRENNIELSLKKEKEMRNKCKVRIAKANKKYNKKPEVKEATAKRSKKWKEDNKDRVIKMRLINDSKPEVKARKAQLMRRWRSSEKGKVVTFIRTSLRRIVDATKGKKEVSSADAIDYTPQNLKEHLEKQFRDGMTWENHGTVWHIDHIKPIAKFIEEIEDIENVDQSELLNKINALDNLQPLWAEDNLSKGAKMPEEYAMQVGRLL